LFADAANAVMLITGLLVITQKNKTMYLCGYGRERERALHCQRIPRKKTSEEIKKTVKKLFIFFTVLKTVKKSKKQ
jgi:hypothetical protein